MQVLSLECLDILAPINIRERDAELFRVNKIIKELKAAGLYRAARKGKNEKLHRSN